MFVGGEFYYDTRWLIDKPTVSTENMTFLNGGKACLVLIGEYLLDHGIQQILMPTYLCPTIVATLERRGLTCEYYRVDPDLSIDLEDLSQKAFHHQAVYFINYFGFFHPAATLDCLIGLQQKGILVIEDNAQVGFTSHHTGDFVFNSLRKLVPFDGGYLSASLDTEPYLARFRGQPNRRLPVIREYRKRLGDYLYQGIGSHDELVGLYELAEKYYESDLVVAGDPQEKVQIEKLDWEGIKQARRENYAYMLDSISEISGVSPIFPVLQKDNMPLGLPVYISGISRDWLFNELGEAGIGLTIHWDALMRDPRLNGNPVAVEMASRMLTLAIDQRTSHKQMDYLVQTLVSKIEMANKQPGD
jgi:hypothetical protein